MSNLDIIAHAAGTLINVAMLPQLIKTIRTRDVSAFSIWWFAIYLVSLALWIYWADQTGSIPMKIQNYISFIMALCMLGMVVVWRRKG